MPNLHNFLTMQINLGNGYSLQDWETAWRNGDQERFIPLADDYEVWKNLSDSFSHPFTRANAEAWVSLHAGVNPVVDFAVCDENGPIGGIGFQTLTDDSRHSAALGYWLGQPFWRRGVMTAAVKAMTAYGFETLALIRIYARVYKGNEASARVLEKAGYKLEGLLRKATLKQGVPIDHYLYAILREEWGCGAADSINK